MDLHFKKHRDHYICYNTQKEGGHTHIKTHKTCVKLIKLLENRVLPESLYLIESAKRLLKKHEFDKLRPKNRKQKYVNRGGRSNAV